SPGCRVDWRIWQFQVVPVHGGSGGRAGESRCLRRRTDSSQHSRVVNGEEVTVNNSVAVGEEKELLTNPVGRIFAPRLRASRKYKLRVRQTSCYCSKCRVGAYEDCIPAKKYR
ncbi:unnamed protein product, partial [Pylaiella littoralis]